ncbi:hypothetical protein LXL04_010441 [Taraxacum kok-saghyz]
MATVVSDDGAGFRLHFRGKRDEYCGVHGWHDGGGMTRKPSCGGLGSFENSYISENPKTPKPLTFSKNRLQGAKNRSNTSPVAKKIPKKRLFFRNFAYIKKEA